MFNLYKNKTENGLIFYKTITENVFNLYNNKTENVLIFYKTITENMLIFYKTVLMHVSGNDSIKGGTLQ